MPSTGRRPAFTCSRRVVLMPEHSHEQNQAPVTCTTTDHDSLSLSRKLSRKKHGSHRLGILSHMYTQGRSLCGYTMHSKIVRSYPPEACPARSGRRL